MAKRQKKEVVKFEFKGFQNLEFNDAEKKEIANWLDAFKPDLADTIVCITEGGYKLGVAYDDYHEVYHISATCKLKTSQYCGYVFVLQHVDAERGLAIIRYVYDGMLAKDLYEIKDKTTDNDW